ncbi:uncharacterized protein LOC131322543 isoform X1 [Rhododendron vialii]|uniref:uncharacterized protein LOC131322543 isoform X1 n=1 Tax=Rhododendron vialii TaxID=182163 RepID=UPI00265EDDD9|nr:uncharacterized protein LOC131322543 isoform X1 [Rhododendron vialii]
MLMALYCHISGSFIKHQLVTYLTLGIALRGVLGTLRKPPDSKMFVFGTKALEQFVDRLIEWPSNYIHILQMSHLRSSHSELVAFIERAPERISSGHSESDGGHNASMDLQHGSIQANAPNMELSNRGDVIDKVMSMIVSAASSCATHSCYCPAISQKQSLVGKSRNYGQSDFYYTEARNELFDMYNSLHHESGKLSLNLWETACFLNMRLIGLLEFLGILSFQSESCFHFVNSRGMEQLRYIIIHDVQNSHAITLMVLGVVEQATRHSIGCEGFLGWWPREDESIPSGTSVDYNELFKLLLQKQPHDVASLATHILHRLRFLEVASRCEIWLCDKVNVLTALSN